MLLQRGNKIIEEKSLLYSLGTDLVAISAELIKMNKPATFNYANATQNGVIRIDSNLTSLLTMFLILADIAKLNGELDNQSCLIKTEKLYYESVESINYEIKTFQSTCANEIDWLNRVGTKISNYQLVATMNDIKDSYKNILNIMEGKS